MPEYASPLNSVGLKCFNAPGLGEKLSPLFNISSVIAIPPGATLYETCGHTGCDIEIQYPKSLKDEILQAFQNVENALISAGVQQGWQAVYKMTTYHVGRIEDHEEGLDAALAKYLGKNRPAWCGVCVASLTGPARLEIVVSAAVAN